MTMSYARFWTAVTILVSVCSVAAVAHGQAPFWSAGVGTTATRTHVEVPRSPEHGAYESGYLIGGGLRLTEHLALDLGYLRAGGLTWAERFSEPGPATGCDLLGILMFGMCFRVTASTVYEGRVVFDASALQATAVGILNIGSIWELYGKGGVASYRLTGREELVRISSGERLVREVGARDRGLLAGVGVGANVTPSWRVRLEYQTFWIDEDFVHNNTEASIDTWALMLDYRFGMRPPRRDDDR